MGVSEHLGVRKGATRGTGINFIIKFIRKGIMIIGTFLIIVIMITVNSCNDSLFAGMTLTLRKSHGFTVLVSCSDELAVHSCPLLCRQGQVAKLSSEFFYCSSSLRNKTMAKNLQRFILRSGNGRFLACTVERRHLGG